ncbi:hypothetical protein BHQ17_12530 [Mycolicibacterium holsaticum]|uniref:DUF7159 domain-containing protein n=2 Tax=Mycolicibacterium holsaticum TaxID=152142 RepID=A0A1E3RW58_9MYCO|nr:hypothetical protein BHQ17_12530 [Mycolicibacterium holsaticum]
MGAAVQTRLELSMTPTGICWALFDATGADPAVLDHDDVGVTGDDGFRGHQGAIRGALAIADASGHVVTSVSLRCTDEIQATCLRNWLLGLGFDVRVAAPPGAPQRRRRFGFGPHLRAATIVVAGVIALFAVAPELGGQPQAASAEQQSPADTSMITVPVAPLHAPASALKIYAVPDHPPASQPVVAVAVAAPVDPVLDPPNPVAPAQDPMADALNSVLSALP